MAQAATNVHRRFGVARALTTVVATTALVTTAVAVIAPPASHAAGDPTTIGALQTALSSCTTSPDVTLGGDISASGATLTIGCTATLRLEGHALGVKNIVFAGTGATLTIADSVGSGSKKLTADASTAAGVAGIQTSGNTLIVQGKSRVSATGGAGAAGIGGAAGALGASGATATTTAVATPGSTGSPGTGGGVLTVTGSAQVTATGGVDAPGVGGGAGGNGGAGGAGGSTAGFRVGGVGGNGGAGGSAATVTVSGTATLDSQGGTGATGVGGGNGGAGGAGGAAGTGAGAGAGVTGTEGASRPGGATTISGTSATLEPAGGSLGGGTVASAIGGGSGSDEFGTLVITSGNVDLPAGAVLTVPDAATVGNEVVLGAAGTLSTATTGTTAVLSGSGQINNGGTIDLDAAQVSGVAISGHHYLLTYDLDDVAATATPNPTLADTVIFAGTFAGLPVLTATEAGFTFAGWETSAATAATNGTAITGSAAGPGPLTVPLTATWTTDFTASPSALRRTLGGCTGSQTYQLTQNLSGTATTLPVNCNATIDLHGHNLTVDSVVVAANKKLTVTDSTTSGTQGVLTVAPTGTDVTGVQTTGAELAITGKAVVSARGSGSASAVGGSGGFGTLTITAGTLTLPDGAILHVPDTEAAGNEVTLGTQGLISTGTAPAATADVLTGTGQIANGGTLALPSTQVASTLDISGHHYELTFDLDGVEVTTTPATITIYAATVAGSVAGTLPTPAADGGGLTFDAWRTLPATPGTVIGDSTAIPGTAPGPGPLTVPLVADWVVTDAVATPAALRQALRACTGTQTYQLTADLSGPHTAIVVNCDASLDLNGHDLDLATIVVATGKTLTVTDTTTSGAQGTLSVRATVGDTAGIQTTGATLVVAGGAHVSAAGSGAGSAVGASTGGVDFGVLELTDGTLDLPDGATLKVADNDTTGTEITIGGDSTITTGTAPASSAQVITGTGQISNDGTIGVPGAQVASTVAISGHHYTLSFDLDDVATAAGTPAQVTVYAASIGAYTAAGGDAALAAPTPASGAAGLSFRGWALTPATPGPPGAAFDETSLIAGSATGPGALTVQLVADWDVVQPVASAAALRQELQRCTGTPAPYVLTASLTATSSTFRVRCNATIDLAGHDLTVNRIALGSGTDVLLTSTAGGTLTAVSTTMGAAGIRTTAATFAVSGNPTVAAAGAAGGAGIGGDDGEDGGTVDLGVHATGANSIRVTATGGSNAAGIGGGDGGAGGVLTVGAGDGEAVTGSVVAIGGVHAAGIGGGDGGAGGTVTIDAYADSTITVDASGQSGAAGVGGGRAGAGATIRLGATCAAAPCSTPTTPLLTAAGDATAVGGGTGSTGFGSLSVGVARLQLASDLVVTTSPGPLLFEVSLGDGAQLSGTSAARTITGGGRIRNDGAIKVDADHVTARVTTQVAGRNYRVSFDLNGGALPTGTPAISTTVVLADSFVHAGVQSRFPTSDHADADAPLRPGFRFEGWYTAVTGGTAVLSDAPLAGDAPVGVPGAGSLGVTLYARWVISDPAASMDALVTSLATCDDHPAQVSNASGGGDTSGDPYVITLTPATVSYDAPGSTLTVRCFAKIDLRSADVSVRDIVLAPSTTFTLDDSSDPLAAPVVSRPDSVGVLIADAGLTSPGIPAVTVPTSAALVVTGRAALVATGGAFTAAIGGGRSTDGGTLATDDHGYVLAQGGKNGAGIGGGDKGSGGTTTASGASTITATGGDFGAGIGGGALGDGGTTLAEGTATITAQGGKNAAGIGAGDRVDSPGDYTSTVVRPSTSTTTGCGSAVITSTGGTFGAGIGAGAYGSGATVSAYDESTITATGGYRAAGIGGGYHGDGGTTTANVTASGPADCGAALAAGQQATIDASGGYQSAGIGGGYLGSGGPTTIDNDAVVTAKGGTDAAGVGGGLNGSGSTVLISGASTLDASGSYSALGAGKPTSDTPTFGHVVVGDLTGTGSTATLRLPNGNLVVPDGPNADGSDEIVVTANGQVTGSPDAATYAVVRAGATTSGTIANAGRILLPGANVTGVPGGRSDGVAVSGRHFLVRFESADHVLLDQVTVFDTQFATPNGFPTTEPVGSDGYVFERWETTDPDTAALRQLTAGTDLSSLVPSGATADGTPLVITATAKMKVEDRTASVSALGDTLAGCPDGTGSGPQVLKLTRSLSDATATLTVACNSTIDLNGYNLTLRSLDITAGHTLTVEDLQSGAAGLLKVDASDQSGQPGLHTGAGASVIVTHSARVQATGGSLAAGIGGGAGEDGGSLQILGGAQVTAEGGYTAVGSGAPLDPPTGPAPTFGQVTVGGTDPADPAGLATGTLRLPGGALVVPDGPATAAEISVAPAGRITGSATEPITNATVTGAGHIANQGSITLPTARLVGALDDSVTVSGNYRVITFSTATTPVPDPVTVYADSFTEGDRALPVLPTRPGFDPIGWSAEESGAAPAVITSAGSLAALPSGAVTLYARYKSPGSSLATITSGLADCTATQPTPYDVQVETDATTTDALTVGCDARLDLNGHHLSLGAVTIEPGASLTVVDSATGGDLTVVAAADTPAVTTTGAALTVTGAAVAVTGGGPTSATIGGASAQSGGIVAINGGADVTVTPAAEVYTAIGSGKPTAAVPNPAFGTLKVTAAHLTLGSGNLVVPDSTTSSAEITIGAAGVLTGVAEWTGVVQGSATSSGQIQNDGRLLLGSAPTTGIAVRGHNYRVDFTYGVNGWTAPDSVSFQAATLQDADLDLPTPPCRDGYSFGGWYVTGTATRVLGDTAFITFASSAGTAVTVSLKAQWNPQSLEITSPVIDWDGVGAAPAVGDSLAVAATATLPAPCGTGSGGAGPAATYQWTRSDGAGVQQAIAGATGATYRLGAVDEGHVVGVRATATQSPYAPITKEATQPGTVVKGTITTPTLSLTGIPQRNQSLVAAAVFGSAITGRTLAWQWSSLDSGGVATEIAGATSAAYVPTSTQVGRILRVRLTVTAPGYTTEIVTLDTTTAVVDRAFPATIQVTTTPTSDVAVGDTVALDYQLRGYAEPTAPTVTYQWYADGVAIPDATGEQLVLTSDLLDHDVVARATATITDASPGIGASSPLRVGPAPAYAITLSGTQQVGEDLTATLGAQRATDIVSWRWVGAGSSTTDSYTVVPGDADQSVRVIATVRGPVGDSTRTIVLDTAPMQRGTITAPTLTVSGDARIYSTLTPLLRAAAGTPADYSVDYVWTPDTRPRPGDTLRLDPADLGQRITVTATLHATGYNDVAVTSKPTAKVGQQYYFTAIGNSRIRPGHQKRVTFKGLGPTTGTAYTISLPAWATSGKTELTGSVNPRGQFTRTLSFRVRPQACRASVPVRMEMRDRRGLLLLRGRVNLPVNCRGQ